MPILLERSAELAAIVRALDEAAAGRARTVVLRGEPGIGKSSLLDAATRTASDRGFRVRRAGFTVLSSQAAFGLVWDWFGADALAADDSSFDGPARLVRDLIRGHATAEPMALAYAVHWLVASLAEHEPVLLVVDDLHWADDASRRLLTTLLAKLSTERVAVVVATRPPLDAAVEADLATIAAAPRSVLHEPRPLSLDAIATIGGSADVDPARVLHASGGVPFYVHELIAHGLEASPARVREGLLARLAQLPADAREVVETAAIAADGISPTVLAHAAGVTSERIAGLLPVLDAAGLLVTRGDAVVPTHPIVIEGVLDGLGAVRRAQLHARVAGALRAAGAPPVAIAAHEVETDPAGDVERARSISEAARLALQSGNAQLAARFFARARIEGGIAPEETGRLLLEEGRARVLAGDPAAGLELMRQATRAGEDPRVKADRLLELGDAAYMAGDYATAGEAYAGARVTMAAIPGVSDRERRLVLGKTAANELTFSPEPLGEVLAELQQIEPWPPEEDTDADRALFGVAALAFALSGRDGGAEYALRALGDGRGIRPGIGDDPLTYMLSGALNYLSLFAEGEFWLTAALADARDSGSVQAFGTASYARGALRIAHGRLRAGLADLEAARGASELGWRNYFPAMQYFLAKGYLYTGEVELAGEVARLDPGPQPAGFASVGLAAQLMYLVAAGEPEEAIAFARARLADGPNLLATLGEDWRVPLAEAYAQLGQPDAARRVLRSAAELAPASAPAHSKATRIVAVAGLETDPAAREALYRRALELVDDHYPQAAEAQLGLAELALARGHDEVAQHHARDALRYALAEGAVPLATRAREVLARAAPGESALPSDDRLALLTASELRIAEVAAHGKRNREIARSQFVTVKTVEFHLGNVYRKLGIHSRAELAKILGATADDGILDF
ncbi:ATP-binding protein [Protaetiibacter larvae]|uniref:ATP-binding protein n=1 Tax=Protaetiibacter larvae TaxID=2592654 RepID=UPI00143D89AD|nr:AAA family ATPase [Protaetiibacter larvae]